MEFMNLFKSKNKKKEKIASVKEKFNFVCDTSRVQDSIERWMKNAEWRYEDFDTVLSLIKINGKVKISSLNSHDRELLIQEVDTKKKYKTEILYGDGIETYDEIRVKDLQTNAENWYELLDKRCIINNDLAKDKNNVIPILNLINQIVYQGKKKLQSSYYYKFVTRKIMISDDVELVLNYDEDRKEGNYYQDENEKIEKYLFSIDKDVKAEDIWNNISKWIIMPKNSKFVSDTTDVKVIRKNLFEKKDVVLSAFVKKNGIMKQYAESINNKACYVLSNGNWQYFDQDNLVLVIKQKNFDDYQMFSKFREENKKVIDERELLDNAKQMLNDINNRILLFK